MAKIIWTAKAEQHIAEIEAYIAEQDSHERAMSTVSKIYDAPDILRNNPHLGSFTPELKRYRFREIRVYNWRILFTLSKDKQTVKIQGIWHGARLLSKKAFGDVEK